MGTHLDDGHSMVHQLVSAAAKFLKPEQLVIAGEAAEGSLL